MERVRALVASLLLACVLGQPGALAGASGSGSQDDCDGVMSALSAAQHDAWDAADVVDALDAAINAPGWDAGADGWMVGALDAAVDDLIGALNTASLAEERAHQAHCY